MAATYPPGPDPITTTSASWPLEYNLFCRVGRDDATLWQRCMHVGYKEMDKVIICLHYNSLLCMNIRGLTQINEVSEYNYITLQLNRPQILVFENITFVSTNTMLVPLCNFKQYLQLALPVDHIQNPDHVIKLTNFLKFNLQHCRL